MAVPLIVMLGAKDAALVNDRYASVRRVADQPASKSAPTEGDVQAVMINPCLMMADFAPRPRVAQLANLPALVLSGWRAVCPPRWSLSAALGVDYLWTPTLSSLEARKRVDWGFGLLIAAQWILIGGFQLIRPRNPWVEPGVLITIWTAIGFGMLFIQAVQRFARVPAMFAGIAWFWWLAVLIWVTARFGWGRLARRPASTS